MHRLRSISRLLICAAAASALIGACASHQHSSAQLAGFAPFGSFDERIRVVQIDSGVTATIVAPSKLNHDKPIELILYALPNGNSTAETIGQPLTEGLNERFDIQNIGAQTRALRAVGLTQAVVVYLEANTKSWPEWRRLRGYANANPRIVAMVNQLRRIVGDTSNQRVILTGHSGAGSFAWGFIDGQDSLPSWLVRIGFLDSNYSFEPRHGVKIAQWLRRNTNNLLVSIAYDDREIMLDGKKVVSDSGGTWRATQRMMDHFAPAFPFTRDTVGAFLRYRNSQMEVLLHPNPQNRILHTELVGEMNGYMHAMLVRRSDYKPADWVLSPMRAYTRFVDQRPLQLPPSN